MEERDEARAKFVEALELNDTLNLALFNLANTLRDLGRFDEAQAKYDALKARDKRYPGLAEAVAEFYLRTDAPQKALAPALLIAATAYGINRDQWRPD